MDFEMMLSERGKPLTVFQKFKFRKFRELKKFGETVWYCTNKKCKAKLYTLNNVFSKVSGEHNHELAEEVLIRQKVNNSLKRKATEDIAERPAKLLHKEIEKQSEVLTSLSTKDVQYIKKNINRTRLKTVPKLPKSAKDVQEFLKQIEIFTIKNEQFLLINDEQFNIVVFSCLSNLSFMCNNSTLFMDGTFDYCTKFFFQMFTLHTLINDTYVPVVFCLLPNKQKFTYKSLFELLKKKCQDLGCNLNPTKIVIDYELGIHYSVREVFPEANVVGCRFHLAQAW